MKSASRKKSANFQLQLSVFCSTATTTTKHTFFSLFIPYFERIDRRSVTRQSLTLTLSLSLPLSVSLPARSRYPISNPLNTAYNVRVSDRISRSDSVQRVLAVAPRPRETFNRVVSFVPSGCSSESLNSATRCGYFLFESNAGQKATPCSLLYCLFSVIGPVDSKIASCIFDL